MQEAKINIDSPSNITNSSDTKREEDMWTGRNQDDVVHGEQNI